MKDRDTVLVVDDDPIIRDLVTTILESELGVRVVAVRDGPPVAALAREISPLLVILDVRLPGKSGIEVIKELKAHPTTRAIPVISCSALPRDEEHVLDAGADGYIGKPFDVDDLARMARTWAAARRWRSTATPLEG